MYLFVLVVEWFRVSERDAYFARAVVNRFRVHCLGRGFVDVNANQQPPMRTTATVACLTALGALSLIGAQPVEPAPIPAAQFEQLHAMCKSQPGESRFWDLPWMIQLDEALEKGAAEGKPILVWCGAGGAPVGVC